MKPDHRVLCCIALLCFVNVKSYKYIPDDDGDILLERNPKERYWPENEESDIDGILRKIHGTGKKSYRTELKQSDDKECNCGKNANGCSFEENKKKCDCIEGFEDINGVCEAKECKDICGIATGTENGNVTCKINEEVTCECKNKEKKFDYGRKECRTPCRADDCKNGAYCELNDRDIYFCNCLKGTDGDTCSVVQDCESGRYKECSGDKGICSYDEYDEESVCECTEKKALNEIVGYCEDCDCGESSESCTFNEGVKKCACKSDFAQKGDKCEECKCGENYKPCSFVGDQRKCVCKDKFVEDEGECKECDCGANSNTCRYVEGKKKCNCQKGYAEMEGKCEECDCGYDSRTCSYVGGKKKCDCRKGYAELKGECEECDCGANSLSCSYDKDKKICNCQNGYADNDGTCEECTCTGENLKTCHFDEGDKKCECRDNYAEKDEECTACECGLHSVGCSFEDDIKECKCKIGYADNNGKCSIDNCNKTCGIAFDSKDEDIICEGEDNPFGRVQCKCHDEDKKFDFRTKKCRSPCSEANDCENGASCNFRSGVKFCNCKKDTSGDKCEIINDCQSEGKYEKCTGDRGECKYVPTKGKAECVCSKDKKFNEKAGYCADMCTEDEDCQSDNMFCNAQEHCECEKGLTGYDCTEIAGCDEKLEEICAKAEANCAFDRDEATLATCECNDGSYTFDKRTRKCVVKFCNPSTCKTPSICEFNNETKTGYCKCPEKMYYDYAARACKAPDKCLLKITPCEENEACIDGKCECTGDTERETRKEGDDEKKKLKCIHKPCKPSSCFRGAKCYEEDGSCSCEKDHFYDGSSCRGTHCILEGFKEKCKCPTGMKREEGEEECKPSSGETCSMDCGYGYCVKRRHEKEGSCKCVEFSVLEKGKCILDVKKFCATKTLTDDSMKCNCTGKYKQADDEITCELATCSEDLKKDCQRKGATCAMRWTGIIPGYYCKCPDGYEMDDNIGMCTDACSIEKNVRGCMENDQFCFNSVPDSVSGSSVDCKCPPSLTYENGKCSAIAPYVYTIENIPVMKKKYVMKDNKINYVLLNADLIESMKQMFSRDTFDYGYLYDYNEHWDVIKCSVWINFKKDPVDQLKRIHFQAKRFLYETCDDCSRDFYVWPPKLHLSEKDMKDVKHEKLTICDGIAKKYLCGAYADCKENMCSCKKGFRPLEFTIRQHREKHNIKYRIQRCEDIDECSENKHNCSNDTLCVNTPGDYYCECKAGFKKETRNDKEDCFDMCTPSPCVKGSCSVKNQMFDCECEPGYGGSLCDRKDENYASCKLSIIIVGATLGIIIVIGIITLILCYRKYMSCVKQ